MFDFKDQQIGIRVTAQHKQILMERAREHGQSLTDFVLMVLGSYDELVAQVRTLNDEKAALTRQLSAAHAERDQHRTALERATDLAKQFTAKQVEIARQEAVQQYRATLINPIASTTPSADVDPETFAELRTRLAAYETPELLVLFQQLRGHESDVMENGQLRTVYVDDVPDVVKVMVQSFTPQFYLDNE